MSSTDYTKLIVDSLLGLGESRGSTKDSIWKSVSSLQPKVDLKQFAVKLKKLADEG